MVLWAADALVCPSFSHREESGEGRTTSRSRFSLRVAFVGRNPLRFRHLSFVINVRSGLRPDRHKRAVGWDARRHTTCFARGRRPVCPLLRHCECRRHPARCDFTLSLSKGSERRSNPASSSSSYVETPVSGGPPLAVGSVMRHIILKAIGTPALSSGWVGGIEVRAGKVFGTQSKLWATKSKRT
jgi:hypothetical protein